MRFVLATLAMVIASNAMAAEALAPPLPGDPILGKWSNPKGTLAVQTTPCRDANKLCGAIVWANSKAMADARNAGVDQLIGTQLLSDYRRTGQNRWAGTVYIPDMGRSFSSRIKQNSPQQLTISGCLIGGFLCKSQVWHRVG